MCVHFYNSSFLCICDQVSEQMYMLHHSRTLSDVGYRLRFLICSLVEELLRSAAPYCRVEPFGSSSNGLGWDGCDLDMLMTFTSPNGIKVVQFKLGSICSSSMHEVAFLFSRDALLIKCAVYICNGFGR